CSQLELIKMLNPIITGWSNYYSSNFFTPSKLAKSRCITV
ncbi:MAG: hypothetical protein F6K40_33520, partial [Okeania sp. SIO3I5]|nr:hypothetical protein [Okeania sp. SIO3I5]